MHEIHRCSATEYFFPKTPQPISSLPLSMEEIAESEGHNVLIGTCKEIRMTFHPAQEFIHNVI